ARKCSQPAASSAGTSNSRPTAASESKPPSARPVAPKSATYASARRPGTRRPANQRAPADQRDRYGEAASASQPMSASRPPSVNMVSGSRRRGGGMGFSSGRDVRHGELSKHRSDARYGTI